MKKITLTAALLLSAIFVIAQSNITVKFTGRQYNNRYLKLDTIKVKNITRGWEQTLVWPDTTLNLFADGIGETGFESGLSSNFPNPFHGSTEATLTLDKAGQANIQVIGIDGKLIAETSSYLAQGQHRINVSLAETGLAILSVKTETQNFSLKMMSLGGEANGVSVSTVAQKEYGTKYTKGDKANGGAFDIGDVMSYQGIFAYNDDQNFFSYIVTQAQNDFELVKLYFPPEGALNGKFSVSSTKQVLFSQGNLRYIPYGNQWWFAFYQDSYIGQDNVAAFNGNSEMFRDLFGWGTGNNPNQISTNNADYPTFNDWGSNNIQNGDNVNWYTMSKDEWDYLLFTRNTTSGIRFAKATVNNVNGLIILPDDWDASYYSLSNTNNTGSLFFSNTITWANWVSKLESHGAAFLPAAGWREGTTSSITVSRPGLVGRYYTSTANGDEGAYSLKFGDDTYNEVNYNNVNFSGISRRFGMSVRLVTNVQ